MTILDIGGPPEHETLSRIANANLGSVLQRKRCEAALGSTSELAYVNDTDPEEIVRAVFTLLVQRISYGEIEDVKHVLPDDIRDLWP